MTADRPLNGSTAIRYVVAAALLVNAVVGHILFRTYLADAGRQPVLAATLLAAFVAAIAMAIVVRPTHLPLQLARGSAAGMLLGLAVIAFLEFVVLAATGRGVLTSELATIGVQLLGLVIVQVAILYGSARIEGLGIGDLLSATMAGAFQFWAVIVVVGLIQYVLD